MMRAWMVLVWVTPWVVACGGEARESVVRDAEIGDTASETRETVSSGETMTPETRDEVAEVEDEIDASGDGTDETATEVDGDTVEPDSGVETEPDSEIAAEVETEVGDTLDVTDGEVQVQTPTLDGGWEFGVPIAYASNGPIAFGRAAPYVSASGGATPGVMQVVRSLVVSGTTLSVQGQSVALTGAGPHLVDVYERSDGTTTTVVYPEPAGSEPRTLVPTVGGVAATVMLPDGDCLYEEAHLGAATYAQRVRFHPSSDAGGPMVCSAPVAVGDTYYMTVCAEGGFVATTPNGSHVTLAAAQAAGRGFIVHASALAENTGLETISTAQMEIKQLVAGPNRTLYYLGTATGPKLIGATQIQAGDELVYKHDLAAGSGSSVGGRAWLGSNDAAGLAVGPSGAFVVWGREPVPDTQTGETQGAIAFFDPTGKYLGKNTGVMDVERVVVGLPVGACASELTVALVHTPGNAVVPPQEELLQFSDLVAAAAIAPTRTTALDPAVVVVGDIRVSVAPDGDCAGQALVSAPTLRETREAGGALRWQLRVEGVTPACAAGAAQMCSSPDLTVLGLATRPTLADPRILGVLGSGNEAATVALDHAPPPVLQYDGDDNAQHTYPPAAAGDVVNGLLRARAMNNHD